MEGPPQTANKENSAIWPELWAAFSLHRQRITDLLSSVAPAPKGTLCVWGAGRTTDLDLINLLNYYQKIDLIDLNAPLTNQAMVERGFDEHPNVKVLPAMDLSGLGDIWDQIADMSSGEKLKAISETSGSFSPEIGNYDVVVSTCLLSQILKHAGAKLDLANAANAKNPFLFSALKTIREKHIELMLKHTNQGGTSLLITDLTSSESLPQITDRSSDLERLVNTEVTRGNHFHGLNPKSIVEVVRAPGFVNQIADVQVSNPWVWDSIEMKYLCLAFRFFKR